MESKINQIIIDATNMHDKNRMLRFGQCLCNVTYDTYPDMRQVSVEDDCYYDDSKVEVFLNVVREYEESISKTEE